MPLYLVLVLVLILVLVGLPPVSGAWHNWGYGPSGLLGVVLLVLLVLALTGRL